MGGNIPTGNFLGWNFPWGAVFRMGVSEGETFLEPYFLIIFTAN